MALNFHPAPGIVLIEEIKDQDTTLKLEADANKGNVIKGKVLAVGRNIVTDFNALIEGDWYAKVGDTVFFLSYNERNFDWIKIQGKTYFVVKFQDLRGRLDGK